MILSGGGGGAKVHFRGEGPFKEAAYERNFWRSKAKKTLAGQCCSSRGARVKDRARECEARG